MLQCGTVALSPVFCLAKINRSWLWLLQPEERLEKYQSLMIVDIYADLRFILAGMSRR